jgi:G:T-mismatch repair DNA endonuclease (very short patch repair protein)
MTPLEEFENLNLDFDILNKTSQNHLRRKYVNEHIMTKELLNYLLIDCEYPANYIAKEIFKRKGYVVDAGTIIDRCKIYGIKTKSIKDLANSEQVRKKYELTCLKKYGTKNSLSKGTCSYKKRNKTVIKRYGVTNVFQLEEVKEKSKSTLRNKYGVNNPIELPSYERSNGRKSKLHKIIENLLDVNQIKYQSEAVNKFGKFNKKLNKFYSPIVDILIESSKVVVEINGDYWHGNPKKYSKNSVIKKWRGDVLVSKIWELDRIRNTQIRSFGYKVIVLWENDIKNNIKKVENKLLKSIS